MKNMLFRVGEPFFFNHVGNKQFGNATVDLRKKSMPKRRRVASSRVELPQAGGNFLVMELVMDKL